jgi:hypothetical protein
MRSKWLAILLLGAIAACDGASVTEPLVPEDSLEFLRFPAELAPLVTNTGSFWAVSGENREMVLRYAPEPGEDEGDEFLRFKVAGNSLFQRPDGTRFLRGDSVRITVRVDDARRFLFEFEPSGLRFDPNQPAEMRVRYRRIGDDLNGDGLTNDDDIEFEQRLNFWKRERSGDPWQRIGTVRFEDLKELEAEIEDFTGFCIAA